MAKNSEVVKKEENAVSLPEEYFESNLNVGMEDIDQSDIPTPVLNIIQKNSKFVDEEGRSYPQGRFFYQPTKEVFEKVDAALLIVTKRQMPTYNDKEKLEDTYVFIGAIMPGMLPFALYIRGTGMPEARKLFGMQRALRKPMFSMKIQLSTVLAKNEMNEWYKVQFDVKGVRTDPNELVMLEDLAKQYSENRHRFTEATESDSIESQ